MAVLKSTDDRYKVYRKRGRNTTATVTYDKKW